MSYKIKTNWAYKSQLSCYERNGAITDIKDIVVFLVWNSIVI